MNAFRAVPRSFPEAFRCLLGFSLVTRALTKLSPTISTMHRAFSTVRPSPTFQQHVEKIRNTCFSRDPGLWPTLAAAPLQAIHQFYQTHNRKPPLPHDFGPQGPAIAESILGLREVPTAPLARGGDPLELQARLTEELRCVSAMSKNWTSPHTVENVASMTADPALHGMMMGLMTNPNLVHVEYSGMSAKLVSAACVLWPL